MKMMKKQGKSKRDGGVKVVYISSPMKVKTSASKFRSLVQELTGRNSDVARYMENKEKGDCRKMVMDQEYEVVHDQSSPSSDSLFESSFDVDLMMSQRFGMFPSGFSCQPVVHHFDGIPRFDGV